MDIRYSLRARQEEIDLLEYILENFGKAKAKEVYEKIESILHLISEMPNMYRPSNKQKGLRKCVLSKQTSMYYRIQGNCIEIVSFRPNRINPKAFKI
ncbi:type II toxin-antitoxin system RelE/ParE family toxin [Reichenbachiella agarivorans]|uniref:type II toxin-antitoxin system RelE/ParE family toxin n=1 Tax=Reichenbachiella agarivorans TaxID=2979464 RepID=UPI003899D707